MLAEFKKAPILLTFWADVLKRVIKHGFFFGKFADVPKVRTFVLCFS